MQHWLKAAWREIYWGPSNLALLARARLPQWVIYFGGTGFGDDLLLTAVLEELRQRGVKRLAVVSRHEQIFRHSPSEIRFIDNEWRLLDLARRYGARVAHPLYLLGAQPQYDVPSGSHLITEMCRSIGLTGSVALKPYFYLTAAERAAGRLCERQAVIQCPELKSMPHAPLKFWSAEGCQRVVELLQGELEFVQLGAKNDPLLRGAKDLRGQTSIRESAAILANSRVNVGYVGFMMHLARAVDCRSVGIFGGRERPDQSGYAANENLFTPLPCSPCWRRYECLYHHECMTAITPVMVADAARRAAARFGEPLVVERAEIPGQPEPFPLPWFSLV